MPTAATTAKTNFTVKTFNRTRTKKKFHTFARTKREKSLTADQKKMGKPIHKKIHSYTIFSLSSRCTKLT